MSKEGGTIMVDATGARKEQANTSCHCSVHGGQHQYILVNVFLDVDVNQRVEFIINGNMFLKDTTQMKKLNITSGSVITFQKLNPHGNSNACLGISKGKFYNKNVSIKTNSLFLKQV